MDPVPDVGERGGGILWWALRRRGGRAKLTMAQREALQGYIAILPWLIGFITFLSGPVLASLGISFMEWSLLEPPKLLGIANYVRLARDPLFWQALKVTFIYTLATVPSSIVLGFGLAVLLNQKTKGLAIWRTLYYLPAVVSGVAVSQVWLWVLQPDFGVLNVLLHYLGIQGPNWLFSRTWVIPSLALVSLWSVGGGLIIYLAGLQGIPTELYEAASIDGAGALRRFFSVTIPMMTPVLFLQLVMGMIGAFQAFTTSYIMTGGGPGNASLFYVLYIYRNAFQYFEMGYASALAWVLTIVIVLVMLLIFRSARYWVFYELESADF